MRPASDQKSPNYQGPTSVISRILTLGQRFLYASVLQKTAIRKTGGVRTDGILLDMELVQPSAEYKDSFIEAVKEFQANPDYTWRNKRYRDLSVPRLETDFDSFIERELNGTKEGNLPDELVPETTYWLVDGGEFIGRTSIRHRLNEKLLNDGGHIGYDIRPSKRGQGYGNQILKLALEKAKGLGLSRVLLTTSDIRNIASRKIIEKNGGIFQDKIPKPDSGFDILRFWVDIK